MKLHILRHAKTSQESPSGSDFDRELLPKGISQATELANFIGKIDGVEIYCSAAKRTRQTYQLINKSLIRSNIHFSNELYHASHIELLQFLNQLQHKKDVLLIGHNNGISDLITYLTGEFSSLKTCEYNCLEIEIESWKMLSKGLGKNVGKFIV